MTDMSSYLAPHLLGCSCLIAEGLAWDDITTAHYRCCWYRESDWKPDQSRLSLIASSALSFPS